MREKDKSWKDNPPPPSPPPPPPNPNLVDSSVSGELVEFSGLKEFDRSSNLPPVDLSPAERKLLYDCLIAEIVHELAEVVRLQSGEHELCKTSDSSKIESEIKSHQGKYCLLRDLTEKMYLS